MNSTYSCRRCALARIGSKPSSDYRTGCSGSTNNEVELSLKLYSKLLIDQNGRPIFLTSNMAVHTQNIQADQRASLFVGQGGDGDPLGTTRATLIGDVLAVPEDDVGEARQRYLARYENSRSWVEFKDFGFYRLQPLDIYYVGGLGVMGWVTTEECQSAKIDPLAEAAPKIVGHMNSDHVPAMILLARVHAGLEATEATMTGGRPAWISPSAEDRRWHERDAHQLSTRSPKLGRGTQSARVNDPVAEQKA